VGSNRTAAWMSVRNSSVFVLQGSSPVKVLLPAVYKIRSSRLIVVGNRHQRLIRKVVEEEGEEEED
jgi:hypothetical protein